MTNALEPTNLTTSVIDVTGQGSYRTTISNRFTNQWTNGFSASNSTNFPLLGGQTSLPVAWIPIRQERRIRVGSAATTNVQVARMAFFVQDLQGLIDAERMGGSNNRTTGTNPAEISLTNLSGTALMSATTASNFVATNTRRLFASVGALTLSNAGGLATNDLRYVATGLRSWGWLSNNADSFSNRIPPGILIAASTGYTNAGQAKFDLNTNLTAGSVGNLVSILSNNLPGFTNRAGGMAGPTYLSNIAANIVDYADADSTPTYFAPDVRGSEAVAWPNEIIYQIRFTNTDTLATNGGYQYAFKFKQYVETWNIHNTSVPSVALSISNNLDILVRIPGAGGNTFTLDSLTTPDQRIQTATNVVGAPATLRPGEFGMLETPEQTFTYFADGATNATNVIFQDHGGNQVVIQSTNAGSPPLTRTLAGMQIYAATNLTTDPGWLTANQFASAILQPGVYRSAVTTVGGDPRAQFFLRNWQVKCSPYVNYSSPGGRNYEQGNASFANSEVNPELFWPDGGRTIPGDKGANPSSLAAANQRPDALYNSKMGTWSTNLALARVNNSGSFSNVLELGNIFDPIQWADTNQLSAAAGGQRGLWTNLSAAATNDARFCGRNSLRIGRPEFTRFAFTNFGGAGSAAVPNMGMTASAMLDLFRIGSADSNSFTGGGRINLNTAPAPVLAALAGGCRLTNDPALTGVGGSGTNFPIPATMTNAFARGVMKFRQSYPFYSPSQLNFISPDSSWPTNWPTGAVFGNTNPITIPDSGSFLPAGTARLNVTAANDAAMEEWFSKIYGLSGVDSLNFRCYVIAQLTDANGNPRGAPYRKYYQIYTVPYPQTPAFSAVVVEEGSY
jgi:hypothetical protein